MRRRALVGLFAGIAIVASTVELVPWLDSPAEGSPTSKPWGRSTTRVSVNSAERQADHWTEWASISANGRFVVFDGPPTNLDRRDRDRDYEVFLRDRRTGTTRLVSVGLGGGACNSTCTDAQISANGRVVTFTSHASNLTADPLQRHGTSHVFVRDLDTETNELITVEVDGGPAVGGGAGDPVVSADGRYVAYEGFFPDVVSPRVARNRGHILVRDRLRQTTDLVSVGRDGSEGDGSSGTPAMSADGRVVAFASRASNLVARDRNREWDVFVRDLITGGTRRVSVGMGGRQPNGPSGQPSLSPDGRFVAFRSAASNLVRRDTNGVPDVFVRNMRTGVTRRVSVGAREQQANAASETPLVSAGGRAVAFTSEASNLVAGDTNGVPDVFVRHLVRGFTRRASVGPHGRQASARVGSFLDAITPDMRHVVFGTHSANLVRGDTNGKSDTFVRSR
jgi:Tol biopolymer transport system component